MPAVRDLDTRRGSSTMWTCPDCRLSFRARNQAHSCRAGSVEEHLRNATPEVARVYRTFVEALAEVGPFEVHPAKARIGFCNRMTFAAVWFRKDFLGGHLILDEPPDSRRFRPGELPFVHRFELHRPEDVDAEFVHWLRLAHERGQRQR
jgi:hypothetical protein